MIDKLKVINFLQDFGCAKLEHLQIIFKTPITENFNSILSSNSISKKDDIFVHNSSKIDEKMLASLDILCQYKKKSRIKKYYSSYAPIYISFLTKNDLMYHIIVADKTNEIGIVKQINNPPSLLDADKYILAF